MPTVLGYFHHVNMEGRRPGRSCQCLVASGRQKVDTQVPDWNNLVLISLNSKQYRHCLVKALHWLLNRHHKKGSQGNFGRHHLAVCLPAVYMMLPDIKAQDGMFHDLFISRMAIVTQWRQWRSGDETNHMKLNSKLGTVKTHFQAVYCHLPHKHSSSLQKIQH